MQERGHAEVAFDVRTATIDRLVDSWPHVDLLKIDAEGAEEALGEGLTETLARHREVRNIPRVQARLVSRSRCPPGRICATGFRCDTRTSIPG